MTSYTFSLPVSPEQLQAIGMVAAEYSYLESVVEAAIWNFAYVANEEIGIAITTHLTLRSRLDILETLVSLNAQGSSEGTEQLSALRTIRRSIDDVTRRRNEVIHGRWVRGGQGSPLIYTVQARGTLKYNRRTISAEEIRAIAEATEEQARKLQALFRIDEEDEEGPD